VDVVSAKAKRSAVVFSGSYEIEKAKTRRDPARPGGFFVWSYDKIDVKVLSAQRIIEATT